MAPNYANIFRANLEEEFIIPHAYKPYKWYQYIDDILIVWLNNSHSLDLFIHDLNNFHPTIKFTSEISTQKVNFLDLITIILDQNQIITENYHKPTDALTYLHYGSCHPAHQKKSIPFSQYLRMTRNNTAPEATTKSITKLEKAFMDRGYPKHILQESKLAVSHLNQQLILTTRRIQPQRPKDIITYLTTHNPCGPRIREIINQNLNILQEHPQTSHLNKDSFLVA